MKLMSDVTHSSQLSTKEYRVSSFFIIIKSFTVPHSRLNTGSQRVSTIEYRRNKKKLKTIIDAQIEKCVRKISSHCFMAKLHT